MKNKMKFLISMSLNKKIKTKWFVIANIFIFAIIAALLNIDHVISFFGGDFDSEKTVYVIDETNTVYDKFVNQLKTIEGEESNYKLEKTNKTIDQIKKEINSKEEPFLLIFNNNDILEVTFISKGYVDIKNYQTLYSAINNTKVELAIESSSITQQELDKIYSPVNIKREYLDKDKSSKDENSNMLFSTIFPVIILPFFMLTIFLVQMIGAEVNDEKTTRGMEIIISNVSPKVHFFSKVIAGNLFVIIQGLLLLAYGGIGLLIRKTLSPSSKLIDIDLPKILTPNIIDKLIYIIPLTLVLMVLTFVAYAVLAGVLASMTTNTEDFQQLQSPIVIISLAGYYLAMMSNVFEGAIFIKVLSYVPLISAILSPSLLLLGQISIIDIIISIVIMVITNYLFIKYGLRIYKQGILNYTSKNLWKKMWKAVRN